VGDLISSTDFLPTICQAAGVRPVEGIDGVSFLPQIRGQTGQPREWLYHWYSPRQSANLTVREFTFDHRYKLYRTGEFYDLAADINEKQPMAITTLSGDAAVAAVRLQRALDQFTNARPVALDRMLQSADSTDTTAPKAKAKKKKKGNQ
jgi:arylsulfatase A